MQLSQEEDADYNLTEDREGELKDAIRLPETELWKQTALPGGELHDRRILLRLPSISLHNIHIP